MFLLILKLAPVWIFFLLTWTWFHHMGTREIIRQSLAVAWGLATITTGLALLLITQLASALNQLTPLFSWAAWLLADLFAFALIFRTAKGGIRESAANLWNRLLTNIKSNPPLANVILAATVVFFAVLGVFAIEMPTTPWDAHTYHMPRVMHWIQQGNLDHYATNLPRQLQYPPGAEMMICQLMLLAGNDLPANLPQWWALLTSAILAAFLTTELFAANPLRRGQIPESIIKTCAALAAVLIVATPEAAPQAMSSMNDVIAAMWVVTATTFAILLLRQANNYFYSFGCAAAVSLGVATKTPIILCIAPLLLLVSIRLFWQRSFSSFARLTAATLVAVIICNSGWMHRNYQLMGNPVASRAIFAANATTGITPGKVAGNVLRGLGCYTRTPFESTTIALNTVVARLMDLIAEPLNDPHWTYDTFGFTAPTKAQIVDGAGLGNCYIGLLFLAALICFVVRFKPFSAPGFYIGGVVLSFLLFCACLRWDPWHERLEIPYIFLATPFIAAVAGLCFGRWITAGIGAFLLVNAALTVVVNPTFPVLAATFQNQSRDALYFSVRPELYRSTAALADDIVKSGYTNVLLKLDPDAWEYPLWALLKARGFQGRIQHTLVDNESAALPQSSQQLPMTVIAIGAHNVPELKDFPLKVLYDAWTAAYNSPLPEQRVRMIDNETKLVYTMRHSGLVTFKFEPRNSVGDLITNGFINATIETLLTNSFRVEQMETKFLPLSAITSFDCRVRANVGIILYMNGPADNPIATLTKFEVMEKPAK